MTEQKNHLGVMVDCSRNAVMNLDALKKFVDDLAKMGYNLLQLYTEDTYEVKGEPLFGYMRGRYTIAEIKELDAYCIERGITLMPCIQTLAHVEALLEWDAYRDVKDQYDALLVGEKEERTYQLIDNMFASVAEAFSCRKIHIGMDEAMNVGRGNRLDKYGYEDRKSIVLNHLKKVCEIADKYGFKPCMWSDMFFRMAYGEYYVTGKESAADVDIPENVELVYWDYYAETYKMYSEMIREHKAFNRPLWFAGGAWKWQGFHAGNAVSIRRTKLALEACRDSGVKDVLITLWGDQGGECPVRSIYPALVYSAEAYKGNFDMDSIKRKFNEITGEDWDDYMLLDMLMPENLKPKETYWNGSKNMLYNDCFSGKYDSTILGTGEEAAAYKAMYKDLSAAAGRVKDGKYLFDNLAALADVMSIKYDLGYRTRQLYDNRDMDGLRAIIEEYVEVEKRVEHFRDVFEKAWFTENKPYGFDVQDMRLGGLMQRLKSQAKRLRQFVDGEVENIPELDERLVDYFSGSQNFKKGIYHHNRYATAATCCKF